MHTKSSLSVRIHHARKRIWRRSRILFPSPAEIRFIKIMGGRCLTIKRLKTGSNKFPLTIILSFGRTLRRELVRREVRVGAMYVDFAFVTPYGKKAIEIDGRDFHRDIVKEQERDDYLRARGWQVMHIQALALYHNPESVRKRVIKFLAQ